MRAWQYLLENGSELAGLKGLLAEIGLDHQTSEIWQILENESGRLEVYANGIQNTPGGKDYCRGKVRVFLHESFSLMATLECNLCARPGTGWANVSRYHGNKSSWTWMPAGLLPNSNKD